jgi:hypothetical protein
MKTLLAAALLLGASSVIGHVEWEILDSWRLTSGGRVLERARDDASYAPSRARCLHRCEAATAAAVMD